VSQRRYEREGQKERQTNKLREQNGQTEAKQESKQTRELPYLPPFQTKPINGTFTLVAIFPRATVLGTESDGRLEREGKESIVMRETGMLAQSSIVVLLRLKNPRAR
jgi:hypothetical protein